MKRFLPWCLASLLLPLAASCHSDAAPANESKSPPRVAMYTSSETPRIYEALLTRVVPRGGKICYVSLGGKDPDTKLVRRLRNQGIPVTGLSRSPHPFKSGRGSGLNKEFMLRLKITQWVTGMKVQVLCESRVGSTLYTLEQKDLAWKVTGQKMLWIS